MKLAITSNLDKQIDEKTKGGTELFTYLLARSLAKRPEIESIDFYGVGANAFEDPKIHFIPVVPKPLAEFISSDPELYKLSAKRHDMARLVQMNLGIHLYELIKDKTYDLIHDNSLSPTFMTLSKFIESPIVSTLHTNFDSPSIVIPYALGDLTKENNHYFVPISKHQEDYLKSHNLNLNIFHQIYNGLDIAEYHNCTDTSQHAPALWIGRISRKHNKGLKDSLLATKDLQTSLEVVYSLDDMDFYTEDIKPHIHDKVTVKMQPATLLEKNEWYGNGSFLIYPVAWEEPFPNVILETMASGTPVIAYAKGSLPESVEDGKTGYIVNSSDDDVRGDFITKRTGIEGLKEAIIRLQSLPQEEYHAMRMRARKRVEDYFTVERMAENYLKTYQQILEEKK